MANTTTYIVSISNTEVDGVTTYRVNGTQAQIKSLVNKITKSLIKEFKDDYDMGYDSTKDLRIDKDGSIAAYPTFNDYHIDIVAKPEPGIINLPISSTELDKLLWGV